MRKFIKGDRVEFCDSNDSNNSFNGDKGTVIDCEDSDNTLVNFDDGSDSHYHNEDLKLINKTNQTIMKNATYGIQYMREEDPVEFFETKEEAEKRIKELLREDSVDKDSLYLFHIDKKWKVNQPVDYDLVDLK